MENKFLEEQRYLKAKKKVKEIKGFYSHFIVYVIVNLFISGSAILGLTQGQNGLSLWDAMANPGIYATWFFWGIGVFFHWLGVFGIKGLTSKQWEEQKIKELMEKDKSREERVKF